MSFQFLETLKEGKISPSDFLRERTISCMDCNEYKQKISPDTPRIKPQKAPDFLLSDLALPPILEEAGEQDFNERICNFSLDQQFLPQAMDEEKSENDSFSTASGSLSFNSKQSQLKQKYLLKKSKQQRLEQLKRNRASSVALPRFSIYNFLKKIIRKSKRNQF